MRLNPTKTPVNPQSVSKSKKPKPVVVADEHKMVDKAYFCAALGLTSLGFHKMVKQGRLPQPVVLGYSCHRWPATVVAEVVSGAWMPEVAQDGGAI